MEYVPVTFDQFSLDARLLAAVQTVGYTTPTPIQQQAIPVVLKGGDILGLAQTGTGKTAAFLLPILQRILTTGALRRTRALILAPTRELAEQIQQSCLALCKQIKIRSAAVYGGVGKGPQIAALQRGVEVIIACPGRLLDLMSEGHVNLTAVELFVLDEADQMCDMGFLPDVRRIINKLPAQRQTLFFSATMPDEIRQLADNILHNPTRVQVDRIAPAQTVSHALYPVPGEQKKALLLAIMEQLTAGKVLIFTRTKYRAQQLARTLSRTGYSATALQGNMSQNQRQRAMDGFRTGHFDVLVATDIAARGIDVAEITHVINYDIPDTVDAYTHRIGRTGRAAQTGDAYTLAVPEDGPMVRDIERTLGTAVERRRLAGFEYGEFVPEAQFATAAPPPARPRAPRGQQAPRPKQPYRHDRVRR